MVGTSPTMTEPFRSCWVCSKRSVGQAAKPRSSGIHHREPPLPHDGSRDDLRSPRMTACFRAKSECSNAALSARQFIGPCPPKSSRFGSDGATPVRRLTITVTAHSTTPIPISTPAI